jgi:hypothetical protein
VPSFTEVAVSCDNEYRVPVWPSTTACAETLWCGHVFADLERPAHFGEFIRRRERPAGVPLDAVQTVPDSVRVNIQLGCGIGDRALIGKPRPEGVEEDIFFFAWQVGTVEYPAERTAALGIPMDTASSIALEQGPQMDRAILRLYRSARQPAMAEAGRALENAAARPGLSQLATEDTFVRWLVTLVGGYPLVARICCVIRHAHQAETSGFSASPTLVMTPGV